MAKATRKIFRWKRSTMTAYALPSPPSVRTIRSASDGAESGSLTLNKATVPTAKKTLLERFRLHCHPERERGIWAGGRGENERFAPSAHPGPSLTLGVT